MEVRAILFDVFGTVVDWRGTLIRDLTAWGDLRGLAVDWPGLIDAWRGAYLPSMNRVRRGEVPWTNLDGLHRASLDVLGPRFGLPETLPDADRDYIVQGWHRLDPWPDSVAGLTRLKRHFIIATLSNGGVALLVNMAKRAGLPWDMVFSAEVFRHYKPDPETYQGAAAMLGLRPEETMLAAAHPRDLQAAREAGLRTAFISRPKEYGTDQKAAEGTWDQEAKDICDLASQLLNR